MGKLEHKVAIVTGGQRGLGAAIVRELVGEGARCYFFFPPADAQEAGDFADGLGDGARRCRSVPMSGSLTRSRPGSKRSCGNAAGPPS